MVVDLTISEASKRHMGSQLSLPPLSPEDMKRASELAKTLIRAEDRLDDIVTFGSQAHGVLALISRDMLAGVRVGTLDEIVLLSDSVIEEIHSLNVSELSTAAGKFLIVFRETSAAIRHRIDNFFRRWEMVNDRLERKEAEILSKETEATERYYRDAELARTNFDLLREAQIMLVAIKIFLDGEHGYAELERRQQRVMEEQEAARRDNRAVDFTIIVAAERYAKYIQQLESKATSLAQMLVSAYQTSIAVRGMADNENIIRQKLSDIRTELLPMWQTNVALAYQAYQQQGIAKFIDQCMRAEEEIRYWTADQIERAARSTADIMTRPFNMAAIQYFNDKLASSLDILKTASVEAKKIRDEAEVASRQLIAELGDTLADNSRTDE